MVVLGFFFFGLVLDLWVLVLLVFWLVTGGFSFFLFLPFLGWFFGGFAFVGFGFLGVSSASFWVSYWVFFFFFLGWFLWFFWGFLFLFFFFKISVLDIGGLVLLVFGVLFWVWKFSRWLVSFGFWFYWGFLVSFLFFVFVCFWLFPVA